MTFFKCLAQWCSVRHYACKLISWNKYPFSFNNFDTKPIFIVIMDKTAKIIT